MKKSTTNEDIIDRFKKKWGDKFDYSDVDFKGYKEKVHIFCKEHQNWFWQTPYTHLKFNGCKECSKELKSKLRRKTNEDFINDCKKIYGDEFILDKVNYKNNHEMVEIICKKHGSFFVKPFTFLKGNGCPKCNHEKPNKRIMPFDKILERFREKYGDKYQYDESTYVKCGSKMRMICPKHGEFWQTPYKHLNGRGCPECGKSRCGDYKRYTLEQFIEKGERVHNKKYDYSQVKFEKLNDKVKIICHEKDENGLEHGEFTQSAASHLNGSGCPKCAQDSRNRKFTKTFEKFVQESNKIHQGKNYKYDEKTYKNRNTKTKIICPVHGEFWQKPSKHLIGHGCPSCAKNGVHFSEKEYIERANEVHNGKYIYDEIDFKRTKDKIKIICPTHGVFYQEAQSHLTGHGCPKCASITSSNEVKIVEFLKEIIGDKSIVTHERKILNGKEIDIFLPDYNIGIEYNGLYWHSEKILKDKYYHLHKTEDAKEKGINIIQIFEDEWVYKENIVKSKLKQLLKVNYGLPKIMARKCFIQEINSQQSSKFLEENHIQGSAHSTVHLGAFYNDTLIGVMLFKKDGKTDGYWELNRFATDINFICQGIGGKLFNYFLENYSPIYIKSFADRRWTIDYENNLYTKLNFKLEKILGPDYRYYPTKSSKLMRIHKFNFRKQILSKKYGLPIELTESKMAECIGAYKIWDCGLIKYSWNNTNINAYEQHN